MRGPLDVHRELLARDVQHEIVRLPRIVLSADQLPEALGVPAEDCLAVRLFEVDDELVAVLLPVRSTPNPAAVMAALHARTIRVASAERINAGTDYAAGLVPPLPLPAGVALLTDPRVSDLGVVYTPTGDTGTALGISAETLLSASGARVAEIAAAQPRRRTVTSRRG